MFYHQLAVLSILLVATQGSSCTRFDQEGMIIVPDLFGRGLDRPGCFLVII